MENNVIANHSDLVMQLAVLRAAKEMQEMEIKESFNDITSSLSLLSVFKEVAKQERSFDIAKFGAGMLLDFVVDQFMVKNPRLKANLSAAEDNKFPIALVITNLLNIVSGVSFIFRKIKQHNDNSKQQ